MDENEDGGADQCRGNRHEDGQELEGEEAGKEEADRELGHLFDGAVEVGPAVWTDAVEVAGLQVVRQAHQNHTGKHQQRAEKVHHAAGRDGETAQIDAARRIAGHVKEQAAPEEQ